MKYKEIVGGEYYESGSPDDLTFPFYGLDGWGAMSISADYEIIIDAKADRAYEV